MNKKNICIDLDTQRFMYEPPYEGDDVTSSLAIMNATLADAAALAHLNSLESSQTLINRIEDWMGEEQSTIDSTATALSCIDKLYGIVLNSGLVPLPEPCPFINNIEE